MNKSSKMVSLFLSTALVFGTVACAPQQQQQVYDQEGNPITVEEDDDDDGFFGMFLAPFGFSRKHSSSGIRPVQPSGVTSGGSSYPNTDSSGSTNNPGSTNSNAGISSGSSTKSSTGISSGTHGGIGGGGSSAS
ncbi:hypothetical protein [Desulfosporosinus lacus]|nr:hypothetical protein [Desulfosporosinus lacus]